MKKLSTVLLFVLFIATTQVFANAENPNKNSEKELRKEVALLLESPAIKIGKENINTEIRFTLTADKEIIVLNVNSETEAVINYVKSRLDHKKVDNRIAYTGKVYRLALKIQKP